MDITGHRLEISNCIKEIIGTEFDDYVWSQDREITVLLDGRLFTDQQEQLEKLAEKYTITILVYDYCYSFGGKDESL